MDLYKGFYFSYINFILSILLNYYTVELVLSLILWSRYTPISPTVEIVFLLFQFFCLYVFFPDCTGLYFNTELSSNGDGGDSHLVTNLSRKQMFLCSVGWRPLGNIHTYIHTYTYMCLCVFTLTKYP